MARALNAAKTETERQSVLLKAESKGLASADVEAKAAELDTPGESTTRKAGLGYSSKDGVSAHASQERVVSVEGAMERKDSRSLALADGQAVGTLGREETYYGDDDSKSRTSSAATVGIGKDGLTAGYSGGTVATAADGSSQATTAGVSANISEGKVGGNIGTAKRDAEGKVESGMSAAGELDFNANGELEGASAQVAATKGPVNVVVAGQYKYTIAEPKLVEGMWVVTYTKSVGGNASLGGTSAGGHSANIGGSASETSTGERRFKTKGEADAFQKKGPTEAAAPTTAEGAAALAVGDRVSTTDAKGAQVGGSAMIQGLQVGGKLQIGKSHSVTVVKADPTRVHVEVTDADTLGGEASLGTFGVSMKAGASRTLSQGVVLEFDISTPAGQAAFEQFRRTGVAPASGARLVARTSGRSDSEVSGVGLGIVDITATSTVEQSTTETADGDKIERAAGTDAVGVDAGFLGKHQVSTTLDTSETNDASRAYGTKATIDSSSAESANHELAAATGVKQNSNIEGAPKGQWSVTSHFSDAQIQTLCAEINSDHFNYHSLIYRSGHGAALIQAVKGSGGNMDAVRLALSEFISETGSRGLELMRDTIGGKFAYDLNLAGDKYFTGASGREATERQIADFKARLASPKSDKGSLIGQIATCLSSQQEKLAAIGDPRQYPELPSELRTEEIAKTRSMVKTLEQMRDQALASLSAPAAATTPAGPKAAAGATPAAGGKTPADKAPGAAPVATPATPTPVAIGPATPAQVAAAEWQMVLKVEAELNQAKENASNWRDRARKSRWVQVGGAYAFMDSAQHDFGERGFFGDGELAGAFEAAAANFYEAQPLWEAAEDGLRGFEKRKTDAAVGMAQNPAAWVGRLESSLAPLIRQVTASYIQAQRRYKSTEDQYQSIKASILAKNAGNVNAYFLGYRQTMPDGANVP